VFKKTNALIACCLGLLIPGWGHIYQQRYKTAFVLQLLLYSSVFIIAWSRWITTVAGGLAVLISIFIFHSLSALTAIQHTHYPLHSSKTKLALVIFPIAILTILAGMLYSKSVLLGIQLYFIPSNSMAPTLKPGDIVIADTWITRSLISPGEIVIFRHPTVMGMSLIKRIDRIDEVTMRVMGDNPKHSLDSRVLGRLDIKLIEAKAVAVIRDFSFNALEAKPNPQTSH
jgi:signal peptidase I